MANPVTGVAFITGAASGIGRETAYSFAEAGASGIVFADFNEKGAQESAEHSKKLATNKDYRALVIAVDVTKPENIQTAVDQAVKEFGRIDYSVHSAGSGIQTSFGISDISLEEFDYIHNVNTRGTMLTMRAVTKVMQNQEPRTVTTRNGVRSIGRGSIINLGSANSYMALPGKLPYTTSKFAVMAMTKTAALDCAPHNIRVNAVCPSWVSTPLLEKELEDVPSLREFIKSAVPVGRIAAPEEVADVIVFLSSPAASYINGTGLIIDSGVTLTAHQG